MPSFTPSLEKILHRALIPPKTVFGDDRRMLSNFEKKLKRVVYGQDQAISALVSSIKLA